MKYNGGKAVVEVLREEGVRKVFFVPGESFLSVLDAFYEHPEIEPISARHEGGASFMAEGYAKASGEVGVCMATRGVGSANLAIGIHTAQQDSTPMVALIGQIDRPFKGKEAFQEVDLVSFFSHLCKWTVEIDSAERIPELLHRAFHIARSGRPGPVLVALPEDMLADITEKSVNKPIRLRPAPPDAQSVREAAEKLVNANRPVIIAGGGVLKSKATQPLIKLAETLQIPIVTAFRRFDTFPNSHPNYIGTLGLSTPSYLLDYIKQADVVLGLGTRFSQITTQDYTLLTDTANLIHVDISPDVIGKVYTPSLAIAADINEFLKHLLPIIEANNNPTREQLVDTLHEQYIVYSTPKQDYQDDYVDMDGMMYDLIHNIPENTIITTDAGNFYSWLSRYYRFEQAGTFLGPTSGAMGYGLPSAIGAKLAHTNQPVISISGDGGFMMTMQEFETAVRYNIPVISIVVNNNMYGTIRMHQEKHFPNRVVGTELTNPSFAKMAQLFGGHGERVEKNTGFIAAIQRALSSKRPALIEVMTNSLILSANQVKPMKEAKHLN